MHATGFRSRVLCAGVLSMLLCVAVRADEGPSASDRFVEAALASQNANVKEVLQLDNIRAEDAAQIAKSIEPKCLTGVDRTTNSIVISGPADAVASLVDILRQLDAKAQQPSNKRTIAIDLNETVGNVSGLVHSIVSPRTEFWSSPDGRQLVIQGPADDIEEVLKTIQRLGVGDEANPPQATVPGLQLSFWFIEGTVIGTADEGGKAPGKQESQSSSQAGEKLRGKLDMPIAITFHEEPLEQALDTLAKKGGINVVVLWGDLEAVGIDRDMPITLDIREPIRLQQVFEAVIEQAGGGQVSLGMSVDDGVLTIATEADLSRKGGIQVYDVSGLIGEYPQVAGQRPATMANVIAGDGGEGEGPSVVNAQAAPTLADQLKELIITTVARDSWIENGGGIGVAEIFDSQLVVRQTPAAQAEIAALLRQLREQKQRVQMTGAGLPPQLQPVAKSLGDTGFRQPAVLAQLVGRVGEGDKYSITGEAAQAGGAINIFISGRAAQRAGRDVVDLQVEAMIRRNNASGRPFSLETALTIPIGDYVVLAASPSETDRGDSVALVVRVERVE